MGLGRGRGGGGLTNERDGTDHVISGPMTGLEKTHGEWTSDTQTFSPQLEDNDTLKCGSDNFP